MSPLQLTLDAIESDALWEAWTDEARRPDRERPWWKTWSWRRAGEPRASEDKLAEAPTSTTTP